MVNGGLIYGEILKTSSYVWFVVEVVTIIKTPR